jgi:hypothetical protein
MREMENEREEDFCGGKKKRKKRRGRGRVARESETFEIFKQWGREREREGETLKKIGRGRGRRREKKTFGRKN